MFGSISKYLMTKTCVVVEKTLEKMRNIVKSIYYYVKVVFSSKNIV